MPERPAASIEIDGLSYRYPGADRSALQAVGLRVEPGTRLGLLGPNGAGKSTLMRILCGYLAVPLRGTGPPVRIEVAGLDVTRDSAAVRAQVGYLPEHVPLYHELRVVEHLRFRARIKRVARSRIDPEIRRVAHASGISDRLRTPIGHLSRGYRQRVGLADALLGSPPLLVLDEPTVGLDPNQILEIRAMLRALGGRQTLILSSHILAEVEALCDRVVILSHGRVVADQALDDEVGASHVVVRLIAELQRARALVDAVAGELGVELALEASAAHGDIVELRLGLVEAGAGRLEAACRAIARYCADQSIPVVGLAPGRTPLHERFAQVTGAAEHEAAS